MTVKLMPILLIVLVGVAGPPRAQQAGWHTPPDRWDGPRVYHRPLDPDYAARFALGRLETIDQPEKRELSPNGAYWYGVMEDDRTQPGPWHAKVVVYNERDYHLDLTVHDYRHIKARWVNEKLLYVELWWGRILGTCLVVDVESEKIIHAEMVHDGHIAYRQWQEAGKRLAEHGSDE
ncbi:MAG: hypothetical protein JSV91_02055 [Phycisphaerales bacterium]|nr:MAG: hypothetical protein JSV91_02055 [Phycisphaerales bacterium]